MVWISHYGPGLLLLDSKLFRSEQKPWESDGFFSTRWWIDSWQVYDIVMILTSSHVAFRNCRIWFIPPKLDLLFFMRFHYVLTIYLKTLLIPQLFPRCYTHTCKNNKAIFWKTLIIFGGKRNNPLSPKAGPKPGSRMKWGGGSHPVKNPTILLPGH